MGLLPPTTIAAVDGRAIEYVVAGSGAPPVVLVSGAGGVLDGWYRIFGPLAARSTVVAYNRPGVGKSARPAVAQTGTVLVAQLRAVLHAAGLAPPYLLVAHSLGGLVVNLFSRCYPAEVCGVVLLDGTAPEDIAAMRAFETRLQRGLRRTLDRLVAPDPLGETAHVERTVEQIAAAPPFPNVPLVVISGGKPAMARWTPAAALAARMDHQRRLAELSPRGRHLIAAGSGHVPQLTEPAVVIGVVADMLDGVQAHPAT